MCFNFTCTPTKQKKTLDYILDWIKINGPILQKDTEDIAVLKAWKEEVSDDYIKAQIDAAVAEYDWSTVPEFEAKMDKVIGATEENFAAFDSEGNVGDSSFSPDSFAPTQHDHMELGGSLDKISINESGNISIVAKEYISFRLREDPSAVPHIPTITTSNIANFSRALSDPDETPTQDSDGLITSGGVYTALDDKNYIVNHNSTGNKSIAIDDDGEISVGADYINISLNGDSQDIEIYGSDGDNIRRALHDPDTVPTTDSDYLITSGAVKTALNGVVSESKYWNDITMVYEGARYRLLFLSQYMGPSIHTDSNFVKITIIKDGITLTFCGLLDYTDPYKLNIQLGNYKFSFNGLYENDHGTSYFRPNETSTAYDATHSYAGSAEVNSFPW